MFCSTAVINRNFTAFGVVGLIWDTINSYVRPKFRFARDEPIPAWLEQALTDSKQPYQIGFRDGYEQAKREIQDETCLAVAGIGAKTAELSVETQAMHAELVRMRTPDGAADNEPDPPTRPN
jgi:hypothetical protein